jgi:hypothetical protein
MRRITSCLVLTAVLAGCESGTEPADPTSAGQDPQTEQSPPRAWRSTAPASTTLADHPPQFDQSGSAGGGQPQIFRFEDEFDFVIPAGEIGQSDPRTGVCPFAVRVQGQKRLSLQFFDTYGVAHNEYMSTLTNLATGFAIRDDGAWKDVFHFDDPENVTVIGSNFHITIPGRGMVGQDTGYITVVNETGEVLFEGGPHENFRDGTLTCALLASSVA